MLNILENEVRICFKRLGQKIIKNIDGCAEGSPAKYGIKMWLIKKSS